MYSTYAPHERFSPVVKRNFVVFRNCLQSIEAAILFTVYLPTLNNSVGRAAVVGKTNYAAFSSCVDYILVIQQHAVYVAIGTSPLCNNRVSLSSKKCKVTIILTEFCYRTNLKSMLVLLLCDHLACVLTNALLGPDSVTCHERNTLALQVRDIP